MRSIAEDQYQQGILFHDAGRFAEAVAAFDRALMTAPDVAAIHYCRGNSLVMQHRMEEALGAYERCLALDPGRAEASYNRSRVLVQLRRWQEALNALDGLVQWRPDVPDAWNNRAGVLQALGRHAEALQSLEQVLKLRPDDARALCNAGILLLVLKRFDEASVLLGRAVRMDPGNADALGNLASAALRACDWHLLDEIQPVLFSRIEAGSIAVPPLSVMALTDDARIQRRSSELNLRRILADSALPGANPKPLAQAHDHHQKLRVGYLSSEFGEHPVAAQIVGLLEGHDRTGFEVIGLFTGQEDQSLMSRRVVASCDGFIRLNQMGDLEAATAIRNAEIDILIDLNGHTMGWRPAILKYRPALVVAAYLGYAGSTGADFVDYIIGDPHVTPFALAFGFSEQIVQLPDTFWPTDPTLPEPAKVGRAELGLPQDTFVFCCFNSNHKIRPRLFDSWARILNSVPDSVLWIRDGSASTNDRFRHEARARGVDAGRIHFAGRTDDLAFHFGRQAQADLFLDTFPYNAHATASDALWSGLPLLTLQGKSFASRVSADFLVNLGLGELIATSFDDYEQKAITLARDVEILSDLRGRLAQARTTSPLFDSQRLARSIEAAYRQMHARAILGESPAAFSIH